MIVTAVRVELLLRGDGKTMNVRRELMEVQGFQRSRMSKVIVYVHSHPHACTVFFDCIIAINS